MDSENKEMVESYSYSANGPDSEEENRLLRETVNQLNGEIQRLRKNPLIVCTVKDVFGPEAVIELSNGNELYVQNLASERLCPGDSVLVEQKNFAIIRKARKSKRFTVDSFVIIDKPKIAWSEVGGLAKQEQEIKEVVELPLKRPELFRKIGIDPPKGILLHGPPGTGKTLLAKAVATSTNSTFIEIVGSELVQKFIGEGAKLVKELFELAREKAPAIVFIDEIDAIAAKRIDLGTSGEREVQRTFMQLLAELDGFKPLDNVKIIGATNMKDILDPAMTRPGRLDRLIYCGIPDEEGRREIFKIHTKRMSLTDDFSEDEIVKKMDSFTGAEIKAACTEAGYFAIRANKATVSTKDFLKAIEKVRAEEELEGDDYLEMFG